MKQTVRAQAPASARATSGTRRIKQRSNLSGSAVTRNASMIGMELAREVCAITNPFCDASRGSKWPDQSAGQTLSVPVRVRHNITTDASGNAGTVFTTNYPHGILIGHVTHPYWDWGVAAGEHLTSSYAPLLLGADQFRVVSAGVRVTPITSAMNSQGILNLIELPVADNGSDYVRVDLTTKAYPSYESLPLKAHDSVYAIMRPNGPTAREFKDLDDRYILVTDPVFETNDWTSIMVSVAGGPATTTVAVVDVYINLEVTISAGSAYGFLTTRAPLPNLALTNASAAITQGTAIYRGSDGSVDESFMSRAWSYLKGAGTFLKDNARPILQLGAAGVQAYNGNLAGAGGHLMMLADRPYGTSVD